MCMKNLFAKIILLFFMAAFSLFGSCASRPECRQLYWLEGEVCGAGSNDLYFDSETGGAQCVYNFDFENLSDIEILRTEFVLSLFDEDGEPVLDGDWIKFDYVRSVLPGETVEGAVILDEWLAYDSEKSYVTDYFYAGRIEYADGSVFEDPFGRYGYS